MEPGRAVAEGYYSSSERPPVPVVRLNVYTPSGRRGTTVEARVDTGFSGTLLLSIEEYLRLGLHLYEDAEKIEGLVAGGYRVELRVSRCIVELGGFREACEVYTTVFARRSLLGRGLLDRFTALLDAPRGVVRLEAPPAAQKR
ncbi:hypothetical protein [Infirmifilum sp. SLHALR2]|nr:MAG: hypothetical protein B7L53_06550 [Thermofilum sp. NZ13]